MSNIIEFPTDTIRNDVDIERGVREALSKQGFSETAINAAVNQVMPLFKESKEMLGKGLNIQIPNSISDEQLKALKFTISSSLESFQRENSKFTQKIIVNLALLVAQSHDV